MIIVAGWFRVEASGRDAAVAAHAEMIGRARAHPGCLDIAIGADLVDPSRINSFELWADQAALDAWRKVAHPPEAEITEDHVRLYRTGAAESPF